MNAYQVLADWLTFAKTDAEPTIEGARQVIADVLQLDPALFEETHGVNGYFKALEYEHILVCYEPFGFAKGVCVVMSGQGCRTYESLGGSFEALRHTIYTDPHINLTRWDIAVDVKDNQFTMETLVNALDDGGLRSHCQDIKVHVSYNGRKKAGITVYIGSRRSDYFIRIYDKAKEVYDPNTEPELYNTPWIRVELVLKKQYATNALTQMENRDDIGQFVAEAINGHMAFINQDDSNISRCSLKSWWADFLQTLETVKLWSKGENAPAFDKALSWAQTQLAPTLAMLYKGLGGSLFYKFLIEDGAKRMSLRHDALLKQLNCKQAFPARFDSGLAQLALV